MATETIDYVFNAETGKFEKNIKSMNGSIDDADKKINNFNTSLSNVGKGLTVAGGVLTAFGIAGVSAIKSFIDSANTQIEAETKLEEVMRTRMNATDDSIQSVKDYASALQETGVIGDEVQLAGAQQVATFLDQDESIKTLLPAMNNLAAQQKGVSATQEDMINYGNLFGKVMQGQTSALSRVGITFTDAQEQILKFGTEEERASTLAQVVNDNVGNMNETLANTPEGQMAQVSNTMGDIAETIGFALLPVVLDLVNAFKENLLPVIQDVADFFLNNSWASTGAVAIVGISLALGGLMLVIGPLLIALPLLGTALGVLFSPITLIVGAIIGLIAYFTYLYNTSETFRNQLLSIVETLKGIFLPIFEEMKSRLTDAFAGIGQALSNFFALFSSGSDATEGQANVLGAVFSVLGGVVTGVFAIITGAIEGFLSFFEGIITVITGIINGDWAQIWDGAVKILVAPFKVLNSVLTAIFGDAFTNVKQKAINILNSLISWVKGLPGKIGSAISSIPSKFSSAFSKAKDSAINFGKSIIDWFKGIPSSIASALASLPGVVADAFSSAASSALDAVSGIAGSVASALNPFDYTMEFGNNQSQLAPMSTNNTYNVHIKEEQNMSSFGGVQQLKGRLDAL